MKALVDAYLESFPHTPLIMQLADRASNHYGLSKAHVGWRVDCLGDLGFWAEEQDGFNHMYDKYPMDIINLECRMPGKRHLFPWKYVVLSRAGKKDRAMTLIEVRFIIDESLKWHISSFNNKSSGIPAEWWPEINRWLKKMGYRFVLRKFTYPGDGKTKPKSAFYLVVGQ